MSRLILAGIVAGFFSLGSMASGQTLRAQTAPTSAPIAHTGAPFHRNVAKPSSPLLFLTSDIGKKIASKFSPLAGYLSGMGVDVQPYTDEWSAHPTVRRGVARIL